MYVITKTKLCYIYIHGYIQTITSKEERKEFNDLRALQKEEDAIAGIQKNRSGRFMKSIPDDFFFLMRTVGLLRGLAESLCTPCPILTILALHAHIGVTDDDKTHLLSIPN